MSRSGPICAAAALAVALATPISASAEPFPVISLEFEVTDPAQGQG